MRDVFTMLFWVFMVFTLMTAPIIGPAFLACLWIYHFKQACIEAIILASVLSGIQIALLYILLRG